MNSFEILLADFAEKTGVTPEGTSANSVDVIADDVMVSAQYRPERDDCVIFTLPVEDQEPDERTLRRALELAAHGAGTRGHFLGITKGMLVLSAVLPLDGLTSDEFGSRLLELAAASRSFAEALGEGAAAEEPSNGESAEGTELQGGVADLIPV